MIKVMKSFEEVRKFDEGVLEELEKFVGKDKFSLVFDESEEDYILEVRGKKYYMVGGYEEFKFVEMK